MSTFTSEKTQLYEYKNRFHGDFFEKHENVKPTYSNVW